MHYADHMMHYNGFPMHYDHMVHCNNTEIITLKPLTGDVNSTDHCITRAHNVVWDKSGQSNCDCLMTDSENHQNVAGMQCI